MDVTAFFTANDDGGYAPTGLGASHWDKTKQGGAPLAGLAAQLLDGVSAAGWMQPVRLTIDILGAVPMAALHADVRVLREGKRVQLAEIELSAEGRTWVRASMLRLRSEGVTDTIEPLSHPFPDNPVGERRVVAESFRVAGDGVAPGPGAMWMRVITPVIEGEPINRLAAIAMAADWGTTVSVPADPALYTYANLDIGVHLTRLPESNWMLLDGTCEAPGNGIALTNLRMGDSKGMFATAHQSVFIDRKA